MSPPAPVKRWVVPASFLAVVAVAGLALSVGATGFTPGASFAALLGEGLLGESAGPPSQRTVVLFVRLPRIVAGVCVGGALGAAGCMLQAVLRNPLASPFVIGASSAAAFGVVLGILCGAAPLTTLALGFGLASASGILVLSLARTRGRLPTESVVLAGFGVGLLFSALTGLVQFATPEEWMLREMVLWLMGGLWRVTWDSLALFGPLVAAAVAVSFFFARELDLLSLGELDALRLGASTTRTRAGVLLLACLLTSVAVSLGGVVAFVGLVVPHVARKFVGVSHGRLLPVSAAAGALLVVAADTLARTAVLPNELPLGVVTSLVGVPFFLGVLRAVKRKVSFL